MSTDRGPVFVVGAGPSGLAAAYRLQQAGERAAAQLNSLISVGPAAVRR